MCTELLRSPRVARGSIFKRSGGWAFRVDAGYQPGTGKRRQLLRQGFRTRKEAEAALAELLRDNCRGAAVSRSTIRVEEFLEDWLGTVESKLRPTTHHSYSMAVHRITRDLGRHQLQVLTPMQIEKFYARQLISGGRQGRGLSPKTVRNMHVVLRKALADAERLGVVQRNAAAAARPPTVARHDLVTWTSEELQTFMDAVEDHRLHIAFLLLATTAMRRGEVLGLRWSDVDLAGAQLSIAHTTTTAGNRIVSGPPKTTRSRRLVYLDRRTVACLTTHRARQSAERLAAGPAWRSGTGLVVCDQLGAPIHPDQVSREFKRITRSICVAPIRLHDLRHTYATLALKAGVHPKVVSERLGHATIAVTLDLYSHVVPSIARDAAELVASQIFRPDELAPR